MCWARTIPARVGQSASRDVPHKPPVIQTSSRTIIWACKREFNQSLPSQPPNPTFPATMFLHYFAALIQVEGGGVLRKRSTPVPPLISPSKSLTSLSRFESGGRPPLCIHYIDLSRLGCAASACKWRSSHEYSSPAVTQQCGAGAIRTLHPRCRDTVIALALQCDGTPAELQYSFIALYLNVDATKKTYIKNAGCALR